MEHFKLIFVGLIYLLERIISFETYRKHSNQTKILPKDLQKKLNPYLENSVLH